MSVNNNNNNGMDDIKAQLYAALMKKENRIGQPEYRYFCETDGRQYFRCECSVQQFETQFVASETAKQKKQAQTKAAMSFAAWMVENGHLKLEDVPQLKVEKERTEKQKDDNDPTRDLIQFDD